MRLLIGILSCRQYAGRREGCRHAWVSSTSAYPWIETIFVVGASDAATPYMAGDILYVPCLDDYDHLPQKTLWLVEWAANQGFDFLFKCDDDTYVHIDRLVALVRDEPTTDFTGYEVRPGLAAGGAGYLLSSRALHELLAVPSRRNATGSEDVLVSLWLADVGITVRPEQRFWSWETKVPTIWNTQITAHYISPEGMGPLHASLTKTPRTLFRVLDAYTEQGALGVNGYRGFSVDGSAVVGVPQDSSFADASLVAAHATSWVVIETDVALIVRGFLDAASDGSVIPVDLMVNEKPLGRIIYPNDVSAEIVLAPGLHHLEAIARGDILRRHSVWVLRPA